MNPAPPREEISRSRVVDHLRQVVDPEVGLNVVDLGLIYDLEIEDGTVRVTLTMTTPACPMSGYIRDRIDELLGSAEGVEHVETELVWEPAWSPQMIHPEYRR